MPSVQGSATKVPGESITESERRAIRVESILSARLLLVPQSVGDRIYFISNLSGHLSLFSMADGGSIPQPLLPPHIALHNPHLLGGESFKAFPELDRIVVMIDRDGDEVYQPMRIPLEGGYPEPAFGDALDGRRVFLIYAEADDPVVYLSASRLDQPVSEIWRGHVASGEAELLHEGTFGAYVSAVSDDHSMLTDVTGYGAGDTVIHLWQSGQRRPLLGKPIEDRSEDEGRVLTGFSSSDFTPGCRGLVVGNSIHDDLGALGYIDLDQVDWSADPDDFAARGLEPITIAGGRHQGIGELNGASHQEGERWLVSYNIDGVSWRYEARLHEADRIMSLERVLVGEAPLDDGVLEHLSWERSTDRYALSFSTATSPTQIYTIDGPDRQVQRHSDERVLGIPQSWMSPGEDASFTSFDGLRISARLYLPSDELGFEGRRPLVYYIHGGPQGQERPDFAWFSMPLIQLLTLRGFAVFVPNARGSTGYGMSFMKRVDRDWGGDDRLDHVHAMTRVLPADPRLDVQRAGVVGRSYGGYMTLTLAARHPELWRAACDMFGPYDLLTFMERIPETWKPYFRIALGDAEEDRAFLVERSPRTWMDDLGCPLLVIQGANDPRVVADESEDLVGALREQGKDVEYLLFEDEGHDVLKRENRVRCYNAITDWFLDHLTTEAEG